MVTEVADIRSFQQQGPRQFVFDCQIELFGITGPIVRVNADDAAGGMVGKGQIERRYSCKAVYDALRDELGTCFETIDTSAGHNTLQPQCCSAVRRRVS